MKHIVVCNNYCCIMWSTSHTIYNESSIVNQYSIPKHSQRHAILLPQGSAAKLLDIIDVEEWMSMWWWCMSPINCATGSRLRDLGQAPAAEVGENDECCPTSPTRSPLPSMCQITHMGIESSLGSSLEESISLRSFRCHTDWSATVCMSEMQVKLVKQ